MNKNKYKMIPVDRETHAKLLKLCETFGMGHRSQGAMVRRLVEQEYEKWAQVKLVAPVAVSAADDDENA